MRDSKIFDNVHQHHSITSEILNACAGAGAENVNPVFLLHGHRGSGKTSVSSKVAAELGASFTVVNSYQLWSESSGSAEEKITGFFEQCMSTNKRRAVVVIRHFDLVGRDANSGQTSGRTIQHLFDEVSRMAVRCNTNSVDGDNSDHSQLIVFATTDDLYSVDGNVIDKFDMVYELEVPLAAVRKLILERQECVYGINEDAEFIASVVKKTPGYLPSDLKNLLFNSLTDTRACEAIESRKITETGCIFNCDCSQYPQLSSYKPNDHEPCREVLHRAVFERIENDAKIHARMSGAPEVPTTSWKDVGGLEAAKSKVRHAIRAQAELRDAEDALTGVMDRIVSQLLAELDDVNTGESSCDVFVMGATNRPDLIDPSLLRPGRFERPVYVGIRGDQTARMSVLRACTRKLDIEPGVDWKKVLDSCHANLTGADFSQVAANAMMLVIERVISTTSAHEQETVDLLVTQKDLVEAATGVRPSVGEAELSDYEKLGD